MIRRNVFQLLCGLLMLIVTQIACGTSTTKLLASALPPQSPTKSESISTQAIIATTAPQEILKEVQIIDFGFGQDGTTLGYGFILENPNLDYAITSSQYQIAAYDVNGIVVTTDSGYIDYLFPGQTTGQAGEIYLEEGVNVDRLEIQFDEGSPEKSDITNFFTVSKEAFIPDEFSSYVVCEITNPFNTTIQDLKVSAILFDENSKIVGGGYSYLDFIEANNSTGIKISVNGSESASQIKIYPNLSGFSFLTNDEELPSGSSPVQLIKTGFGQDDYSVGYGFIVQNPNTGYAIENTPYHITLYSSSDAVIGFDEGYINDILPGETMGVGGDAYLVIEENVSKIVVQILTGDLVEAQDLPFFEPQNISFVNDDYFPKVTGQIINPYTKQVTNVEVTAIAYDESGAIIGSGYTYLDFIPAGGTSAVDVTITISEIPASVELYASMTSISELE